MSDRKRPDSSRQSHDDDNESVAAKSKRSRDGDDGDDGVDSRDKQEQNTQRIKNPGKKE